MKIFEKFMLERTWVFSRNSINFALSRVILWGKVCELTCLAVPYFLWIMCPLQCCTLLAIMRICIEDDICLQFLRGDFSQIECITSECITSSKFQIQLDITIFIAYRTGSSEWQRELRNLLGWRSVSDLLHTGLLIGHEHLKPLSK